MFASQSFGASGILVQVLLIYLVTRDLLVTSIFAHYFVPLLGTVHFRAAVTMLLALVAYSTGGFGPGFSGFGIWGWLVPGSFVILLVVQGVTAITGDGSSKSIVIDMVDFGMIMFAVGVAYLFALRGRRTEDVLRFLLRPYCYLAVFIAAGGLLAWLLVAVGVTSLEDWRLPQDMMKKDVAAVSGYFYSMPYYLSLILTESAGRFLGLEFPRASGLFQEPHVAAFFVTPALFFMSLVIDPRKNRWLLGAIYLVILAFLFSVHSATNLLLMFVLGMLILGRITLRATSTQVRLGALFVMAVLLVVG